MSSATSSASAIPVQTQAASPGTATTSASHKVATSITPCTHHRRGTPNRSSYGAGSTLRILPPGASSKVRRVELPVPVVRLDPGLPLPAYAHPGDAGADLVTAVDVTLQPGERALVPTGIAMAVPEGYVALVH